MIKEARAQVAEMAACADEYRRKIIDFKHSANAVVEELRSEMKQISETVLAVQEAQGKYGDVNSDKAREVIALYGALITMNKEAGASGGAAIANAGYIIYAYLGGQAKREIKFSDENERPAPAAGGTVRY